MLLVARLADSTLGMGHVYLNGVESQKYQSGYFGQLAQRLGSVVTYSEAHTHKSLIKSTGMNTNDYNYGQTVSLIPLCHSQIPH
jgi:hypothetical protein